MAALISVQDLRRSVIGINRLRQQELIRARQKALARALADRIVDVEEIFENGSRDDFLEESSTFDYLETVHDLLESRSTRPSDGDFWGCSEFRAGLDSVLWDVTLVNASPRAIQYHRQLAKRIQGFSSAGRDLIDVLDQYPDLEGQFHRMLRPEVNSILAQLGSTEIVDLDVTDGRFDRDLEARAAFLLAERFLVKDCRMTKENAYMAATILLWYTGALGYMDLNDADEDPFWKAAEKLRRRVRRLQTS